MNIVLDFIINTKKNIQINYGINSSLFLFLYLVTWPLFYLAIAWTTASFLKKESFSRSTFKLIITFIIWISPYLYLIIYGKNLPLIFYIILFSFLSVSCIIMIRRKIKNKPCDAHKD